MDEKWERCQQLIPCYCAARWEELQPLIPQLSWNSMTEIGNRWFSVSGAEKLQAQTSVDFEHYLKLYDQNPSEERNFETDIRTGRTSPSSFYWELREILQLKSTSTYTTDIENVLRAFCARYPKIGYCQGMNIITVWLLLFCDTERAFWLLSQVIENILMPEFYIGKSNAMNGFFIEMAVMNRFAERTALELLENEYREEFMMDFASRLVLQLYVGIVDTHNTIKFWDRLLSEGDSAIIRCTISVLLQVRPQMNSMHPCKLGDMLFALPIDIDVQYEEICRRICDEELEELRQAERSVRAKSWNDEFGVVKKHILNETVNFSQDDLQMYHDAFKEYLTHAPHGQQGINIEDFKTMIKKSQVGMLNFAEQIFHLIDEDKSGYIDFRELIWFLSVLSHGSLKDKLRLCFDIFDGDHSGYLKFNSMVNLVESIIKPIQERANRLGGYLPLKLKISAIRRKFAKINEEYQGYVSFPNFYYSIVTDRFLLDLFIDRFDMQAGDWTINERVIQHFTDPTEKQSSDVFTGLCSRCNLF